MHCLPASLTTLHTLCRLPELRVNRRYIVAAQADSKSVKGKLRLLYEVSLAFCLNQLTFTSSCASVLR